MVSTMHWTWSRACLILARFLYCYFCVSLYLLQYTVYMLFTDWEVRTGKIFCRGHKNGSRPIEPKTLCVWQNI